MTTDNLTQHERELLKEIELKNQPEWLSGGYAKLTLMYYHRVIRANEYNEKLMERCERLEQELAAHKGGDYEELLEEELGKKKEEIEKLQNECRTRKAEMEDCRKEIRELMEENRKLAVKLMTDTGKYKTARSERDMMISLPGRSDLDVATVTLSFRERK